MIKEKIKLCDLVNPTQMGIENNMLNRAISHKTISIECADIRANEELNNFKWDMLECAYIELNFVPYPMVDKLVYDKNCTMSKGEIITNTRPCKFYPYFIPNIEKVIFKDPATIVFWATGEKTVVKCQDDEPFDKEKGLALCVMKYIFGNKSSYNNVIKKFVEGN